MEDTSASTPLGQPVIRAGGRGVGQALSGLKDPLFPAEKHRNNRRELPLVLQDMGEPDLEVRWSGKAYHDQRREENDALRTTAASGVPDMFVCPPAFIQRPGEKGKGTVCSVGAGRSEAADHLMRP